LTWELARPSPDPEALCVRANPSAAHETTHSAATPQNPPASWSQVQFNGARPPAALRSINTRRHVRLFAGDFCIFARISEQKVNCKPFRDCAVCILSLGSSLSVRRNRGDLGPQTSAGRIHLATALLTTRKNGACPGANRRTMTTILCTDEPIHEGVPECQ
jgi:hypothetical protein